MGTTGKRNPDYFQLCPKAVCDQDDYRRQLAKLRFVRATSVAPVRKEILLRAGDRCLRASTVRCLHCSTRSAVAARQVLAPCPACGSLVHCVVG